MHPVNPVQLCGDQRKGSMQTSLALPSAPLDLPLSAHLLSPGFPVLPSPGTVPLSRLSYLMKSHASLGITHHSPTSLPNLPTPCRPSYSSHLPRIAFLLVLFQIVLMFSSLGMTLLQSSSYCRITTSPASFRSFLGSVPTPDGRSPRLHELYKG